MCVYMRLKIASASPSRYSGRHLRNGTACLWESFYLRHKPSISGLNCELPKATASTVNPDPKQLHPQEINDHTTWGFTPNLACPPAPPCVLSLQFLQSSSSSDAGGTTTLSPSVSVNWEGRHCLPKTSLLQGPRHLRWAKQRKDFNQLPNPQGRTLQGQNSRFHFKPPFKDFELGPTKGFEREVPQFLSRLSCPRPKWYKIGSCCLSETGVRENK